RPDAASAVPRSCRCIRDHLEEGCMNRCGLIFRLVLMIAALVVAISWVALHREFLEAARLESELQRFGRWAPLLFVGLYALSTVVLAPGSVLTVVGGALFGPVWGTLW